MEEWKPLVASAIISRCDLSIGTQGEYFRKISVIMAISIFAFPVLILGVMNQLRTPGFGASSLTLALGFDLAPIVGVVFAAKSFWSKSKGQVLIADRRASNILGREALRASLGRILSLQSEFPAKEKQPNLLRTLLLFPNFQPVPELQNRIAALDNQ